MVEQGLGALEGEKPLFLARPRILELAGAINRIRSLQLESSGEGEPD
ncbi:MAG: hypothetical protein ABEL51_14535 [Salinibacter sp.]